MMMYPTLEAIAESCEPMDYDLLDEALIHNKSLADTFLYTSNDASSMYGKKIAQFILKAHRIDTQSKAFRDIEFDVKRRRISESLVRVLSSPSIVIGILEGSMGLPKVLKCFTAQDLQDGSKLKLFIDVTDFVKYKNDSYVCNNLDWFISYLIGGMTSFIYAQDPNRLLLDQTIISKGCLCFSRLLSYIVDRVIKISSVPQIKARVDYLCALYYQINLLQKDYKFDGGYSIVRNNALKFSAINDMESARVDSAIEAHDFDNIDTFIKAMSRIINVDFDTTSIVSTWVTSFQPGTQTALEYFPAFAMMIIHTYIGGYIVNQNLIEKICGNDMIVLAKQLIKINEGAVS